MKRAEEETYREYASARIDQLRRVAYLLCRDWHLADDLVSIALVKLYRHWRRAQRMESLDGYVRKILVNSWLDEQRRPWRREQAVEELPETPVLDPDPDGGALLALLNELPARRRAVLVLRFYCGLSVTQTAEMLGCSEGTVKSQTSRGLDALRPLASRLETT
ncbi:SigE family RNA polymerase sigma factor [Longispora albida]|uniref:SigE family RNA polymerase sigma factor n=1 Tax=Longispora albida TaxID=203523 RepID=UPI0003738712|nr:SigE family RNA polymerase sigma factor [Longispora albida]